jgi:broad specificity phosphatase PhoE
MKNYILLALLTLLAIANVSAQTKTFVLVRHMEKQSSLSANPQLTDQGQLNSQMLAQMLSLITFDGIYSTPYARTEATVAPKAGQDSITIQLYQPTEGIKLLNSLVEGNLTQDRNYLIAGHSNTIPDLVNYLLKQEAIAPMAETDYGKVFVITLSPNSEPNLLILKIPGCRESKEPQN